MSEGSGKVCLVGAGPGDPKLLTIRGKECLEQADVVLYDYLANPALLDYVPVKADRIYVGRRGRGQYQDQAELNRLIIEKAKQGYMVVRLKGGDPLVFGRGGEEAEAVAEAGIPFEIVPGISSAIAVPAYAGIPVTHRTLASTVAFVTGHEDPTKASTQLEWARMASADGTLVFLMGMKNLPAIVENLRREGKTLHTPVALIRWGTRAEQRTITGTLEDIVQKAQDAKMEPPTLVVVGEVVRLRSKLNWFETRPLFGKRILVTRAKSQAFELSNRLRDLGAEPVECPMIQIVPPSSWDRLDQAIQQLDQFQWVVFTSVNGVTPFMERLRHHGLDGRALSQAKLCCIGPRTAEALLAFGLSADLVPQTFQAEGLLEAMSSAKLAGQKVLIPRAAVARDILPEELKKLGAQVQVVPVYETIMPEKSRPEFVEQLQEGRIHILTFTSSSTVRNFHALFPDSQKMEQAVSQSTVACIGPITAQTAKELGLRVDIIPRENTIPAMVEEITGSVLKQTAQSAAAS